MTMEERVSHLERLAELQVEFNGNVAGMLGSMRGLLDNVVALQGRARSSLRRLVKTPK